MLCIITDLLQNIKPILDVSRITREETINNVLIYHANYHNCNFLILITGYGKTNVGYAIGTINSRYPIDYLIGVGATNSSCDQNINLLDIIIYCSSTQFDVNFTGLGYELGVIPNVMQKEFTTNTDLVNRASAISQELCYKTYLGNGGSGDHFISERSLKRYLSRVFNIDFLDFSSGSIGQIAYLNQIPYVYVMGVASLNNSNTSSDYSINEEAASHKACNVVIKLIAK